MANQMGGPKMQFKDRILLWAASAAVMLFSAANAMAYDIWWWLWR